MQSKLYYTDPLKAAWMAREHGVKTGFIDDNGSFEPDTLEGLAHYMTEEIKHPETVGTNIFHVRPDSYHIFEPQEGDLCLYPDDAEHYFIHSRHEPWADNIQIIQRNNTAFFMPEEEA